MLPFMHQTIGSLVITVNAIAAIWLWLLDRWGHALARWPLWALRIARGCLALQVLLGLALISDGRVGRGGHYFFAIIALVATWYAYTRSRRSKVQQLRILSIGCAVTSVCALGA